MPNCLISAGAWFNETQDCFLGSWGKRPVGSAHWDQWDSGNKKQGHLGEQVRVHSESKWSNKNHGLCKAEGATSSPAPVSKPTGNLEPHPS